MFMAVGPYRVRRRLGSVLVDLMISCCSLLLLLQFSVISMYTGYGFFLLLMVCRKFTVHGHRKYNYQKHKGTRTTVAVLRGPEFMIVAPTY